MYILIAYFPRNICRNRIVYVKIITSCKGGTFFFESQCTHAYAGQDKLSSII